jgi:excisionase family DNA binding protein
MLDLLTTAEAATRLEIDKRSVVRAINRGKLHALKRGRDYLIEASEVERYAAARRSSGKSSVHTQTQADEETHEGTEST